MLYPCTATSGRRFVRTYAHARRGRLLMIIIIIIAVLGRTICCRARPLTHPRVARCPTAAASYFSARAHPGSDADCIAASYIVFRVAGIISHDLPHVQRNHNVPMELGVFPKRKWFWKYTVNECLGANVLCTYSISAYDLLGYHCFEFIMKNNI